MTTITICLVALVIAVMLIALIGCHSFGFVRPKWRG